ncbi:hypothetical protein RirG_012300 [Rhizophagus irregularis DAOM 197198w]|uniref:Uncharacterized protein n=1 Tax=Rhizophagus irregularis (strain DAOM 197198w) TaxID=1432141 RepID=A0A015KGJ6_RHIIW|nr:hypothetical protein RirG_012300 [Rhizophagus irregularis DAOM 197198w]
MAEPPPPPASLGLVSTMDFGEACWRVYRVGIFVPCTITTGPQPSAKTQRHLAESASHF